MPWSFNRSGTGLLPNNPTHVAIIVGESETKTWQMKNMLEDVDSFFIED
jgi:hypothetical protein